MDLQLCTLYTDLAKKKKKTEYGGIFFFYHRTYESVFDIFRYGISGEQKY